MVRHRIFHPRRGVVPPRGVLKQSILSSTQAIFSAVSSLPEAVFMGGRRFDR
jgi:hypothetical protein